MVEAVGFPVIELVRISFGPVSLGTLGSGNSRRLTPEQVGRLLAVAGLYLHRRAKVRRARRPRRLSSPHRWPANSELCGVRRPSTPTPANRSWNEPPP